MSFTLTTRQWILLEKTVSDRKRPASKGNKTETQMVALGLIAIKLEFKGDHMKAVVYPTLVGQQVYFYHKNKQEEQLDILLTELLKGAMLCQ